MNIPTVSLLGTVPSMGQPSKERERDGGWVLGTLHEEGAPASLHGRVSRVEPEQTCAIVRPTQLTV